MGYGELDFATMCTEDGASRQYQVCEIYRKWSVFPDTVTYGSVHISN